MELRQLRHFVVLAKLLHFSRAADKLCITQPALSNSIHRLEVELRVLLFERRGKQITLTRFGRDLLKRATEITALVTNMEEHCRAIAEGHAGVLAVGFTPTLLFRGLTLIINDFGRRYPKIELNLRQLASFEQTRALQERRLDAGFVNSSIPPNGCAYAVFLRERYVACLSEHHPLATESFLRLSDLKDNQFVLLRRDLGPFIYDYVLQLCLESGFHPKVAFVGGSYLTSVALVAAGIGVSLLPESIQIGGIPGCVYIPIAGQMPRPTAYLCWNEEAVSPALENLIEVVARDRAAAGIV